MAGLLLVALAAAFVVLGSPTISAPFGDSHDGRNAGVWAQASRSLREDPLGSRLGALTRQGDVTSTYSNHPPLIIGETAVAEAVAGERPWASRMPAWLGSLALIPLAYLLVRELGVAPLPAAAGVALGLGCPMFFRYGTMLDTPVTSLPVVACFLLVWLRSRRAQASPHAVLLASLAALSVLAGWQGALTAAVLVGWGAVVLVRSRSDPAPGRAVWPVPVMAGAMTGVVLLTAWAWWSHGSLAYLLDQFVYRSGEGGGPVSLGRSLVTQWGYLRGLVAQPVLAGALIGLWLALRRPESRPLVMVLLITTVGYALLFRGGAYVHSYWNYWVVLLAVVGVSVLADRLVRAGTTAVFDPRVVAAALVTVTVAVVVISLSGPVGAPTTRGLAAGALARDARWPDQQRVAWFYRTGEPPSFLEYYSRRPAERLPPDPASVPPDDLVLAKVGCVQEGSTAPRYVLARARDLHLPFTCGGSASAEHPGGPSEGTGGPPR